MRPLVKIVLVLGFSVCVFGAAIAQSRGPFFDTAIFRNKESYRTVLGFDLRNDENPRAGLWLRPGTQPSNGGVETRFLPLGVPIDGSVSSQDFIVISGKVSNCCSLFAYLRTGATSSEYSFALPVEFSQPPPIPPASWETLPGRVYLLKLGPAQRLFLYRYGGKDFDDAFADIKNLPTIDKLDAIAVAMPPGATGSGIEGNRTSVPDPITKNDVASFFPGDAPSSEIRTLRVSYTLPPTANQQMWVNGILQLISVIAVPLIALVFWDKASRKTVMFKIMLGSAVILELSAIGSIVWFAIKARNSDAVQALISVIIAVIGMTFSAYLATIKRRDKAEEVSG